MRPDVVGETLLYNYEPFEVLKGSRATLKYATHCRREYVDPLHSDYR